MAKMENQGEMECLDPLVNPARQEKREKMVFQDQMVLPEPVVTLDLVVYLETQDHLVDQEQWDLLGLLDLKDHGDRVENLVSKVLMAHLEDLVKQELQVNWAYQETRVTKENKVDRDHLECKGLLENLDKLVLLDHLVQLDHQAGMELMGKRVQGENQDDQERMVFQDNLAKMVEMENLDQLVLMAGLERMDLPDQQEQRVTEDQRDQLDQPEMLEGLVHKE